MDNKIKPAKGIRGFLIPSIIDKKVYFRVYDENKNFIDFTKEYFNSL